jgi:hypothetical protein
MGPGDASAGEITGGEGADEELVSAVGVSEAMRASPSAAGAASSALRKWRSSTGQNDASRSLLCSAICGHSLVSPPGCGRPDICARACLCGDVVAQHELAQLQRRLRREVPPQRRVEHLRWCGQRVATVRGPYARRRHLAVEDRQRDACMGHTAARPCEALRSARAARTSSPARDVGRHLAAGGCIVAEVHQTAAAKRALRREGAAAWRAGRTATSGTWRRPAAPPAVRAERARPRSASPPKWTECHSPAEQMRAVAERTAAMGAVTTSTHFFTVRWAATTRLALRGG